MNEELLTQISNAITVMANEIKSLKEWRNGIDQQCKEEDAKAEETKREFEKFISERKAEEARRAADADELKKMMM